MLFRWFTRLVSVLAVLVIAMCLWFHVSSGVTAVTYGVQWIPVSSHVSASSLHNRADYIAYAHQCARDAGLDPSLFERQIWQESGFDPSVVSPAGAIGIAQFMPSTAQGLGVNPSDPASSLCGAARLMASYVQHYGSYAKALAAYNAGSGALASAVSAGGSSWCGYLPQETYHYILAILGSCQ
jgi:soluble lytic murein transglycosylase-like protein